MTAAPLLPTSDRPMRPARPSAPRGGVRRPRLVAALAADEHQPLAAIVAPAGFGKTTLLREWSAHDPRPFAWLALNAGHDSAWALTRAVAQAVDATRADAVDGRIVLVLDDVQVLRSDPARDTLAAIVDQLPDDVAVALASRTELPIPVARLRAEGVVSELRDSDLALTRTEAATLLRSAGLELERHDIDALFRTTEGWPVALSLAVRALADQPVPGAAAARFGGADRLVAHYLRDELLAALTAEDRRFARRTAILDVLTAPACDSVLERSDSDAVLSRLLRSGFPLVALDRTDERYRHHRLLRGLLRAELARTDADLEAELHHRASVWYSRSGDPERGLRHALAAQELTRAGDLVWAGVPLSVEQGSSEALERRLGRFTTRQIAAHARLALAAAGTELVHGQGARAEHWLAAAAAAGTDREVAGGVAALHAALGRNGPARAAEEAEQAAALLAPNSPCQALCGLVRGVAAHLLGDRELARECLQDGVRRAAVPAPHVHALCLAQLALMAIEEHDWEAAARLSSRARAQVTRYGLASYATSALVLAVAALVRVHRGRVEAGRADADAAEQALEQFTDLADFHEAEVRVVLARTALKLSELNAARAQLAAVARLAARCPEAVVLHRWLREAEAGADAFAEAAGHVASSLTTAELKILQFLPTHLTFREIGQRTFVSANTVKTQANAIYRKLHVRSRSEAVALARTLGLLADAPG